MTRQERIVAVFLWCAVLGCGGFVAAYATSENRLFEGASLTAVMLFFSAAALGWAFWIVPHEQVVDEIEEYPSPETERVKQTAAIVHTERTVGRSTALVRLLSVALGVLGVALAVPLRSLGPNPYGTLFHTKWRRGDRLARLDGTLVRTADMNVRAVQTVFPEGAIGDPMSQATLLRLPNGLVPGTPDGYIAYSRLCTHAGCPVALYRSSEQQLICPCHQSIFDVVRNGAVLSGPADHALPRLPLIADTAGYLRADGDFPVPVGPGFWERP